ncbi:hypothetical protein J6590_035862 [Homalodisca vitripennis]|nr:hypothetical protein J6590_035862 [Homalodisca vitripennis]
MEEPFISKYFPVSECICGTLAQITAEIFIALGLKSGSFCCGLSRSVDWRFCGSTCAILLLRARSVLYMRSATSVVNITEVCKPSGRLLDIASTPAPPANHAYVILVGTNALAARNHANIFRHFEQVMVNCKRSSRVLVSPLLTRYDLPPVSPVHKPVLLANNYIAEVSYQYEGVELFGLCDLGREHLTAHGLHLQGTGN